MCKHTNLVKVHKDLKYATCLSCGKAVRHVGEL